MSIYTTVRVGCGPWIIHPDSEERPSERLHHLRHENGNVSILLYTNEAVALRDALDESLQRFYDVDPRQLELPFDSGESAA